MCQRSGSSVWERRIISGQPAQQVTLLMAMTRGLKKSEMQGLVVRVPSSITTSIPIEVYTMSISTTDRVSSSTTIWSSWR